MDGEDGAADGRVKPDPQSPATAVWSGTTLRRFHPPDNDRRRGDADLPRSFPEGGVVGPPQRPARVWRCRATYPQRWSSRISDRFGRQTFTRTKDPAMTEEMISLRTQFEGCVLSLHPEKTGLIALFRIIFAGTEARRPCARIRSSDRPLSVS
jgi:hypothetical protein